MLERTKIRKKQLVKNFTISKRLTSVWDLMCRRAVSCRPAPNDFASMRLIKQLLVSVALLAAPAVVLASEGGEAQGLSTYAPVVLDLGFFKVTNSMIVTWIVALGLIGFAKAATSKMQMVPAGLQNFWEWLVESLASFLEGILGWNLAKQTFWFFATIFIFIIFTNWAGLIPGVGTIGWGIPDASGHLHRHLELQWNITSNPPHGPTTTDHRRL